MPNFHDLYRNVSKRLSREYLDGLYATGFEIEEFISKSWISVEKRKPSTFVDQHMPTKWYSLYFISFIIRNKRIPSQREYSHYFIKENEMQLWRSFGSGYADIIKNRINRAYLTNLRELHLYYLLKESSQFEQVLFTVEQKIEYGVDLFVMKNHHWYGLKIQGPSFGSSYKQLPISKTPILTVSLAFNQTKSISSKNNALRVYGVSHLAQIASSIDEYQFTMS